MKKQQLEYAVCAKTIYNLIDRDLVSGVSNESLWEKRKRKKRRKMLCRKKTVPLGRGIECRPEQVGQREEVGHWEIDLVGGGQGKYPAALLTLTERKTRKEIIRKLKDKTQAAVIRAINGIEFLDYDAIEQSVFGGTRTYIYYAHPYSSWERGSNENANRIIRRFIPKGCDISKFTRKKIQEIEDRINNYPRKILGFETPEERLIQELAA